MKPTQKILVLLLTLAYTGQVLAAAALPCTQMAQAGAADEIADTAANGHAGHHMPADPEANAAPMAGHCCDGGLCSMSQCQSAPALPQNNPDGGREYLSFYFPNTESNPPFRPVDSPYRPPISR